MTFNRLALNVKSIIITLEKLNFIATCKIRHELRDILELTTWL